MTKRNRRNRTSGSSNSIGGGSVTVEQGSTALATPNGPPPLPAEQEATPAVSDFVQGMSESAYFQERTTLIEMEQKSADQHDKAILTVATGGLALFDHLSGEDRSPSRSRHLHVPRHLLGLLRTEHHSDSPVVSDQPMGLPKAAGFPRPSVPPRACCGGGRKEPLVVRDQLPERRFVSPCLLRCRVPRVFQLAEPQSEAVTP